MTAEAFEWKALAQHRLEDLWASKAQRKWLQEAISGKHLLIKDLKKVVRQHMKISGLIAAQTQSDQPRLFIEPSDDLIYAMDVQDIGDLYLQTDSVFRDCGLDPTSTETTQFQRTVTMDSCAACVQLVRRQLMLFGYEHTCQSIWMLSSMMHRQEDREDYPGIEDPENTIATKFRVTKHLPGGECLSLKERFVSRKIKENNRTVLVWKALLVGEGSCTGIQTEETWWSIIRPSPTGSGSLVEVCLKQELLSLRTPSAAVNRFNHLLQSIIQENSQEITNGAKALLLEHMLTGVAA